MTTQTSADPTTIRCADCGLTFPRAAGDTSYMHHRLNAHKTPYRCPECNREFDDKRAAFAHFHRSHPAEYAKYRRDNGLGEEHRERVGEFTCADCGQVFDKQQALAGHMQKHSGLLRCTVCGRGFTSQNQLSGHMVSHGPANTQIGRFACPTPGCTAVFSRKTQLNGHMVVHAGYADNRTGTRPVTVVHTEVTVPTQHASVTALPVTVTTPDDEQPTKPAVLDLSVLLAPLGEAIQGVVQATVTQATSGLLARAEDAERRAAEAEARLAKLREALG